MLGAVERLGLRVPRDLESMGFDDVPLASLVRPALSTMRQPIFEKGRAAAQLLVAALDRDTAVESVLLPTEFVARGTTRR